MDLSKLSDDTLKSLYAGKPLDYSKLSDDELKALYQQSSAPVQASSEQLPEGLGPSDTVDSAIRGGLNAVTLNHMPQIAGAIEHPVGAIKSLEGLSGTDVSSDPDVAAYSKTRDQYKNLYNQSLHDHPLAYMGGGLASMFLAPNPTQLMNATTLPGKIAQGAALGAAYGEGGGNADLAKGQIGQEAKDTGIGAVLGGGTAALTNMAGAGLSKVSDALANKSETYQKLLGAFQKGANGQSVIGPAAEQQAGEQVQGVSSDLANKLLQIRKNASDKIGDIVSDINGLETGNIMSGVGGDTAQALQTTPTIGVSPEFNKFNSLFKKYLPILGDKTEEVVQSQPSEFMNSAGEPLSQQLTSQSIEKAIVSGKDLNNFKVDLNQLLGKTKDPQVRDLIRGALGRVGEAFESNPEYAAANQDLKRLSAQFPEIFLNKWVSKYNPNDVEDILANNIQGSVIKANKSGFNAPKSNAMGDLNTLVDRFKQEEQANPGFLKNIGIDNLQDYMGDVKSAGQNFDVVSKVASQNKHSGLSLSDMANNLNVLGMGAKTGAGKAYLTANRLGGISNIGQKLYEMPIQALSGAVPILRNAGLENNADMLERAITQGGNMKNAALFTLLQNPQSRDILHAHVSGLQNNSDQ